MHNQLSAEQLTTQDKTHIFNNLIRFHHYNDFVKMIASFAIGLGLDDEMEEQK